MRQLLLPLLVALLVQASDSSAQPADKQPGPKTKDEALRAALQSSIKDVPALKDVVITDLVITDKGIEILGRVPDARVLPELRKRVKDALENLKAIPKDSPHVVDVEGVIRQDALEKEHDREVGRFLNHRVFRPGTKAQGRLTEVIVGPDGVVVLRGSVSKADMRALVEAEAMKALDDAFKSGNLPRRHKRVDAAALRRYANEVFGILESSLRDQPDLVGFKLIHAELTPAGLLDLAGLAASEEQKGLAKQRAVKAIVNAIETGALPKGVVERVDMTKVLIGSSAVDELLVIELLAPGRPTRVVRASLYFPDRGVLILSGIVESEAVRTQIVQRLEALPILERVDVTNVLVRQSGGLRPGEMLGTMQDANDALGRMTPPTVVIPSKERCERPQVLALPIPGNPPEEMLQAATASLRNSAPGSAASLNAWYMRAAAHLMQGRRQEAIGDLRVAQTLAQFTIGVDSYYTTLERFQGPIRIALSNLLREGPRAAVPPFVVIGGR
jgi:hypothetical protein